MTVRRHYTETPESSARWLQRASDEAHSIWVTGQQLGIPGVAVQAKRLEELLHWHHVRAADAVLQQRQT